MYIPTYYLHLPMYYLFTQPPNYLLGTYIHTYVPTNYLISLFNY
jgi:hypothetical protein